MNNTLILFSAIAGIFVILYVVKITTKAKIEPYSMGIQTSKDVINEINKVRKLSGLQPLSECQNLDDMASAFATDQYQRQFFSHVDPEGATPVDRARNVGYASSSGDVKISQLLAYDKSTPIDAVASWVNDASNFSIINDPVAKHIGAGGIRGGVEAWKLSGFDNWNRVPFWCCVIASGGSCSIPSVVPLTSFSLGPPSCSGNECYILGAMENSVPKPYSGNA
jgi:hypothetical protein